MTNKPQAPDETDVLFYVLRRKRAQARLAMLYERIWPALWPPLGILAGFLVLALLEVPSLLPPWARIALLAGFALGMLAALVRGIRRIAAPSVTEADRRLERATGLRHRPLEILQDSPALPGADSLWQAHIARARAQIVRLRVGLPRPGLAAIDRHALRALALVALIAALGVAGEQTLARLGRAIQPGFAPPATPAQVLIQAWITPPAHTGLAPVFLKAEGGAASVPAGAHLTINLSGGDGVPEAVLPEGPAPFATLGPASFQADRDLATGGRIAVRRAGRDIAAWDVTVIPNRAPEVRFPEPPGVAPNQRVQQTRLPWQVSHAYGVTGLQAELRLKDRPDAPPLVIAIPLPGGSPKQAKGARQQDLTPHPWAGLPVIAVLVAREATGLTGRSAEAAFTLPERDFQHPVAQALVLIRKQLSLRPQERTRAAGELQALAAVDDVWKDDLPAFLNLQAITALLLRERQEGAVEEAQERLWQLALHFEEGAPERTAKALEQARQAVREMLEAEKRGEQIDKAELEKRMKEVQEALDRHLQALAEQAKRDPGSDKFDPDRQRLDAQDLRRLTEEMRKAGEKDEMDKARDKLAEMEKLLEELEKGGNQAGRKAERQKQRAEKRQRGEQQMSAVQDMVRREGGLLDHTQGREDAERGAYNPLRPGFPRPNAQSAQSEEQRRQAAEKRAAERKGDQRVQQALRRALGELMQQHGDLTGEVPPNLGEADSAMRDAGKAMEEGRDAAAAAAAQKAIAALQKGSQAMSQQMARMFGRPGQQDGDDGDDGDDGEEGQEGQNGQDGNQQGEGNQPGNRFGNQPGGRNFGPGQPNRPWGGRRGVDRRADEKRDPLGRQLKEGSGGLDESGMTQVPEEMEAARSRAIQDELRRRGAERTRPPPELDYIDRLLKQF